MAREGIERAAGGAGGGPDSEPGADRPDREAEDGMSGKIID